MVFKLYFRFYKYIKGHFAVIKKNKEYANIVKLFSAKITQNIN